MTSEIARPGFVLQGTAVSPGIVRGKAYLLNLSDQPLTLYNLTDSSQVAKEIRRLKSALRKTEHDLRDLKKNLNHLNGIDSLHIIDVYIMILKDKSFVRGTIKLIEEAQVNAELALKMTTQRYRSIFERMSDDYLRQRVVDIEYVSQRVQRHLAGMKTPIIGGEGQDLIIIAQDLSPADTAQFMIDKVLGFATEMGGKTSHTAILAKALGIPAVVGLKQLLQSLKPNDEVIVDGSAGLIIVNPEPEVVERYEIKKKNYLDNKGTILQYAHLPALTRDNHLLSIGCNIEFLEEIPAAITCGAEGIGLYRTEFMYLNRSAPPTEEEHYTCYSRITGNENLSWITIRTFDMGADKIFSEKQYPPEANPQLGMRAIRFSLREKGFFIEQLRAIARAAAYGQTRILFPLISSVEEIREAKAILEQVKNDLQDGGATPVGNLKIGIMIEVPSAVVIARDLAREVDFFSIGTNDLIQYLLAIDRVNERVTYLYEPLHPAVLRMIHQVVCAGHEAGIKVAMCGEMAGDPLYTCVLLGMEIDELSMNPTAIPLIKKIIRQSSREEARQLVAEILTYSSVKEISTRVQNFMQERFPEDFCD